MKLFNGRLQDESGNRDRRRRGMQAQWGKDPTAAYDKPDPARADINRKKG